jgi:solute carrier family 25 (mitochondrial carnitine/acylcarnitine transporter), member 20/29
VELVKIKLQINTKQFQGFSSCIKETIAKPGGFINLYRGFFSTLLREIPFNIIYFVSYEETKKIILKKKEKLNPVDYLLCGGIAGTVTWAVIYPTDIIV